MRALPRRRIWAPLTAATAMAVLAGGLLVGVAPAAHADGTDNAGFLAHLNGLRAAHGLPALVESGDLVAIATEHSAQMEAAGSIFHNPALTSQVPNWEVVGENVGMGPSVSAIDTAFDGSPDHYANEISTAYTQVGIGTARDSRGYLYVTLDFRKPMPGSSSATPAPKPPPAPTSAPTGPVGTTRPTSQGGASISAALTAARFAAHARALAAQRAAVAHAAALAQQAAAARTHAAAAAGRRTSLAATETFLPAGQNPLADALALSRSLAGLTG